MQISIKNHRKAIGKKKKMETTSGKKTIYFEIYCSAVGGRVGIVIFLCYFSFSSFEMLVAVYFFIH